MQLMAGFELAEGVVERVPKRVVERVAESRSSHTFAAALYCCLEVFVDLYYWTRALRK